jgi:hypothetical protein
MMFIMMTYSTAMSTFPDDVKILSKASELAVTPADRATALSRIATHA